MRYLRTISIRFWLVMLAALPLSFWALPALSAWMPGLPAAAAVGMIIVLVGLITGLGLDAIGIRRIRSLIREGELWEHAGIPTRAEKRYAEAIRIFDSAWISPVAERWCRHSLRAALARFYLASGSRHPGLEMAAAAHLRANPEDKALALIWLERSAVLNRRDFQSVLTVLADTHYAHPQIAPKLVRIFLALGRVDFSAEQLYRYVLDAGPDWADDTMRRDILALVEDTGAQRGERNLAAEAGTRSSAGGRRMIDGDATADRTDSIGQAAIYRESRPEIFRPYMARTGRVAVLGFRQFGAWAGRFAGMLLNGGKRLVSLGARFGRLIRERERLGQALRWGGLGLLGIWLAFFVWSTFSHMLKSTEQPAQRIEVEIPKPFTIQVAAYLKQTHADRYVALLKKKGLAATVKRTEAGGKAWYLVRVSEFTDKKSAADYGNRLKSENIIEDFFVSNN